MLIDNEDMESSEEQKPSDGSSNQGAKLTEKRETSAFGESSESEKEGDVWAEVPESPWEGSYHVAPEFLGAEAEPGTSRGSPAIEEHTGTPRDSQAAQETFRNAQAAEKEKDPSRGAQAEEQEKETPKHSQAEEQEKETPRHSQAEEQERESPKVSKGSKAEQDLEGRSKAAAAEERTRESRKDFRTFRGPDHSRDQILVRENSVFRVDTDTSIDSDDDESDRDYKRRSRVLSQAGTPRQSGSVFPGEKVTGAVIQQQIEALLAVHSAGELSSAEESDKVQSKQGSFTGPFSPDSVPSAIAWLQRVIGHLAKSREIARGKVATLEMDLAVHKASLQGSESLLKALQADKDLLDTELKETQEELLTRWRQLVLLRKMFGVCLCLVVVLVLRVVLGPKCS